MHKAFQVHKLNEEGIDKARELAEEFNTFLHRVERMVGGPMAYGPTMGKAVEHLELASFYAKKTLAQNPRMQDEGLDMLKKNDAPEAGSPLFEPDQNCLKTGHDFFAIVNRSKMICRKCGEMRDL